MAEEQTSKYWLDQVVSEIAKKYPEGEIVVASGHAPSGQYHFGHLREFLTPSVIAWALEQTGRKAKHIDFVDDFDPLRKVPADVPKEFEQHLGKPLYLVPDPHACKHASYADHYLEELYLALEQLGIKPKIVRAYEVYQAGKFSEKIETTLENLDKVRQIIQTVSGRQLPKDWVPVQLLADDDRLDAWLYRDWDKQKRVIHYEDQAGKTGELDYTKGRVKLNWRVDWPARWGIWQVAVEPFGRDHASKGGSYDTGKELATKIFNTEPPLPVPFDFINLAGDTKKMSASAGTGITPSDSLQILPPELIRYFVVKARPNKTLEFDTSSGLVRLWEEFKEVEQAVTTKKQHEFNQAYQAACAGTKSRVTSEVPFDHLVSVYQAAQTDRKKIDQLLARTGYGDAVKTQSKLIEQEISYVKNWLDNYAPESVKFSLQQKLPKVELTAEQQKFLKVLASELEKAGELDAQAMHEQIYAAKEEAKLEPKEAFQAIYRVLFNQDSGPKAGWFLATLDRDWLIERLKLEK